MVESVTRALTVCATVFAIFLATNIAAQDLAPEEIVAAGANTYKMRTTGKLLNVAADRAMKQASEYCARMKQTVSVKYRTWDLGYGYTLTWSCVSPERKPIDHRPAKAAPLIGARGVGF
jgi:hypothetical protein